MIFFVTYFSSFWFLELFFCVFFWFSCFFVVFDFRDRFSRFCSVLFFFRDRLFLFVFVEIHSYSHTSR